MKIPSLTNIINETVIILRRYITTIISSACATFLGILIPQVGHGAKENHFWLMLMTFGISIPFSFAITTFNERRKASILVHIISLLLLVLLSALFYITGIDLTLENQLTRFLLFNFASYMLVSFSPFIGYGNTNGFWQFNKSLLLRFLLATFFSLVLYLGITIAIFALNHLFATKIEIYEELWFVSIGIFHTWFFLSGITTDYQGLDNNTDYPRGLKIFTQYVLLPLVTIYLLILYVYLIYILIVWKLPVGWVSYLVLGFSITGIFALLLIYPLQENKENRWIRIFARWFFLALLPPVTILIVSIVSRISTYGFTENRYLVLVISIWLIGISLFYTIKKFNNIIIIPVSLCIITIITATGPWGAFSISKKSQQKILSTLLSKNIADDGKIITNGISLPKNNRQQISSIVDYLAHFHSTKGLQPYFNVNLDSMVKSMQGDNKEELLSEAVHRLLGLSFVKQSDRAFKDEEGYLNFSYNPTLKHAISIRGFDYDLPFTIRYWQNDTSQIKNDGNFNFMADDDTFNIKVGVTGSIRFWNVKNIAIDFNINTLIDSIQEINSQKLTEQNMSIEKENELFVARFIFSKISGRKKNSNLFIHEINGRVLVRQKKQQ